MFQVRRVQITNFRGIKSGSVTFDGHTVILGANNSCKTALLEGIAITLGRERVVKAFDDYDFHRGFFETNDPLSRQFTIKVVITGFAENDPTKNADWFNARNGTGPLWWDSSTGELIPNPNESKLGTEHFLAVEIACTGFFDDDSCEYQVSRYYADGTAPTDLESVTQVPGKNLREIGLFLLPSRRVWDRALTFNASTFLKLLREHSAIPDEVVHDLRRALANLTPQPEGPDPENATSFGKLITAVQGRLREFGLIHGEKDFLKYRPTELDLRGILASLTPHIHSDDQFWIPFTAQGAGAMALQNLLLLLEFGRKRQEEGKSFILILEEPELHIYPGLQQQITLLSRGMSGQTIVSTHSPFVASAYGPMEWKIVKNNECNLSAENVIPDHVEEKKKNLIKSYAIQDRLDFLAAIMGVKVLIPEGVTDANWLRLLKGLSEVVLSTEPSDSDSHPGALTIFRTKDARIKETINELVRLGCWTASLTDGDADGKRYAQEALVEKAHLVMRWQDGWEIEDVAAWILEPALAQLEKNLQISGGVKLGSVSDLRDLLSKRKRDLLLPHLILDEIQDNPDVGQRSVDLFTDIARLSKGLGPKNSKWKKVTNVWILQLK